MAWHLKGANFAQLEDFMRGLQVHTIEWNSFLHVLKTLGSTTANYEGLNFFTLQSLLKKNIHHTHPFLLSCTWLNPRA